MESQVFESISQKWDLMLMTIVMLVLIGLVAIILFLVKKKQLPASNSNLATTAMFLIAIFATLTFVMFSWWTPHSMDEIVINNQSNNITTPYGTCSFDQIKEVILITSENETKVDSSTYLVIEEYSGKTHVLSEKTYEIDKILLELNKLRSN